MKRSIGAILSKIWSASCFPLPSIRLYVLITDRCRLQGCRKTQLGLPYLNRKQGLVVEVEHRASNRCMVQISDGRQHWDPLGPAGGRWWTGFCNQNTKNRCTHLFLGLFWKDPWDWKCHVEGRVLSKDLPCLSPCWPCLSLLADSAQEWCFLQGQCLLSTGHKDQSCLGSIPSFSLVSYS